MLLPLSRGHTHALAHGHVPSSTKPAVASTPFSHCITLIPPPSSTFKGSVIILDPSGEAKVPSLSSGQLLSSLNEMHSLNSPSPCNGASPRRFQGLGSRPFREVIRLPPTSGNAEAASLGPSFENTCVMLANEGSSRPKALKRKERRGRKEKRAKQGSREE